MGGGGTGTCVSTILQILITLAHKIKSFVQGLYQSLEETGDELKWRRTTRDHSSANPQVFPMQSNLRKTGASSLKEYLPDGLSLIPGCLFFIIKGCLTFVEI